jgi:RND family efflux transporter MFP subunit
VGKVAIRIERDAPATAISLNDTRISAQITGVIQRIPVQVGDSVAAGDVVAALDCQDYELASREASAALNAARARYEYSRLEAANAEKLARTKSIAKEKLQERRSGVAAAGAEAARLTASLDKVRHDVQKCLIRAPFKAVVVERLASVGELAMPGTPILRLLDLDRMEIRAQVQEQDLASLQAAADPAFVDRDGRYPVELRVILPMLDSKVHSFEVRLLFTGGKAPPGSAGRLQWHGSGRLLPADLLVRRNGGPGVFRLDGGKARFVPLPHAMAGRPARVDLGDAVPIIVDGRFSLDDGTPVRVVDR